MKNLIFDFDGVIGDTWEAAIESHIRMGEEPTRAQAIRNINTYCSNKPSHIRNHTLTDEEMAAEYTFSSTFGAYMHDVGFNLFDDFVLEITKLSASRQAIVSTGSQQYVVPAVSSIDLRFTHILAFENHHSKEEKIETVCKDWGVSTDEVHYFTDTLADVYELQNMVSPDKLIGVSWGFCTKEQLATELKEKYILDTPKDIHRLFKNA